MDQDGQLTTDDISIYAGLASEGDPELDRTSYGRTDARDFLDFMDEWNNPE